MSNVSYEVPDYVIFTAVLLHRVLVSNHFFFSVSFLKYSGALKSRNVYCRGGQYERIATRSSSPSPSPPQPRRGRAPEIVIRNVMHFDLPTDAQSALPIVLSVLCTDVFYHKHSDNQLISTIKHTGNYMYQELLHQKTPTFFHTPFV